MAATIGVLQVKKVACYVACHTPRIAAVADEGRPAQQNSPRWDEGGSLLCHLDELDILAQRGVHEGGEVDALGVGEPGEAVLHFR
jgi:hypothetical protein